MIEAGVPLFLVQLVFWSHSNKRRVGTIFWLPVMLKATAGGGGKGMRAVGKKKIYLKHGMELVKNLPLLWE
jgi:acetyl-CoA carboxylase biotin carboxylase subunit